MIEQIKHLLNRQTFQRGNFGIEREGLRCDEEGRLVHTPHPKAFGEKLFNPYITTDFSESQIELITPVFKTLDEVYTFLEMLYDITVLEIGKEHIWPQSMPCIIPDQAHIPVATFCECPLGQEAHHYRKKLLAKYGGKKQLVSGIHYNFSFDEAFIKSLYKQSQATTSYRTFKDQLYLKVARNYLRYRWILIYLLGSTSVVHESYVEECVKRLDQVSNESYSNKGALSYRNSECGYSNKEAIYPNYESIEKYVESVEEFIKQGVIESPKELYSQVRLKAYNPKCWMKSLKEEGIHYLEYRSIDINPFDKAGIKREDLYFIHLFNFFLLFEEESTYANWQQEALHNQMEIARFGQASISLLKDGKAISKVDWGLEILKKMQTINTTFDLGQEQLLHQMIAKMKDYQQTYAYNLLEAVKEKGYIEAHLSLARAYKKEAYLSRYKLKGYEDLELSTQILIKEGITRGVKVEIIDRKENFIRLEQNNNIQYVKQATKTSKDSYVTVLMMENKIVTKEVLDRQGIRVPKGHTFDHIEEAKDKVEQFVNQPIVIKPKSTNFGVGISIFPKGGAKEDIEEAIEIAFEHDKTVMIESFIVGKEYRFLVINDEVEGVLHRVPAHVKGDGIHTIQELVHIKNQDPLRGRGYKTPLEKIDLDESAKLFLKQKGMTIETIPNQEEVVYLRENSNISTGGDSIDYTDKIPNYFKQIAIRSAQAIGAKICGVDMIIEDELDETSNYAIIEVNFNPAIHIHCYPYQGKERKIASKIMSLLGY